MQAARPQAIADREAGLPLEVRAARSVLRQAVDREALPDASPVTEVVDRLLSHQATAHDADHLFRLLVLDRSWAVGRADQVRRAALTCAGYRRPQP